MNTYNVRVTVTLSNGKNETLVYKGIEADSESDACAEARYFLEEHPRYDEFLSMSFVPEVV